MKRIVLALLAALVMTAGLFYLMQAMITGGEGVMTEPPQGSGVDFVRVKPEEVVQQKERKPQRPPEPSTPPPAMPQPQLHSNSEQVATSGFDFSADISAAGSLAGGIGLDQSDGEYVPIVKVQAGDPRRGLQRRIEGYVVVDFTVTKQGTVRHPDMVEAQPENIFDQAAIDAVLKFKYKPRVVQGEAVEVKGVRNRLTFAIDG